MIKNSICRKFHGVREILVSSETILKKLGQIIWYLIPNCLKLLTPVTLERVILHKLYFDKNNFLYKNASNVFSRIYTDNFWLSDESHSGGGSHISTTQTIRKELPILWEKYGIKTFLDVPCGDYNWMKEIEKKNIIYIGGDVVNEIIEQNNQKYARENVSFKVIDITKDDLPMVDMIFCKDCLQHLSYENIFKALINFKQSNSRYLLVTSYPKTIYNWDILNGDYRPLNLLKKPFMLPSPIIKIHEKAADIEIDKTMYLYELKDIDMKISF
jgi:hypothetical protein